MSGGKEPRTRRNHGTPVLTGREVGVAASFTTPARAGVRLKRVTDPIVETLENRRLLSGAAAGDLDPTFGQNGVATVNFPVVTEPGNSDFADDGVALRAADSRNGLTVLAGEHLTGSNEAGATFDHHELALARLDRNGRLDPSFSGDGTLYSDLLYQVTDVFVRPDNSVLVIGNPPDAGPWTLVRYTAAGALDTSFGGGDGVVTFDPFFAATEVRLASDGKIIVAGEAPAVPGDRSRLVLAAARLRQDGSLDPTFGSGGM